MFHESVILRRRSHTAENVHGDPLDATPDDVPIDNVLVAPNRGPGAEENVEQQTVASVMTLYLEPGSPVPDADDEMVVRGVVWQVHGDPGVWPDGVEVFLTKAGG